MRRFLLCKTLIPFVLFTIFIGVAFFLPVDKLLLLFPDDSYFYLKTANHIAHGLGSTFDGINLTNGYHPLYMYLLSGLSALWPLTGYTGLRVVLVIDGLLFLFFLYWLNRFLVKSGLDLFSRFFVLMSCTILLGFYDFGNESRLLLPLSWLLVFFALTDEQMDAWQQWTIGVLAALVFLTRLDAILWAGFTFLYLLKKNNSVLSIRCLAPLILPVTLAGLGFTLYNYLVFSSPTTVSSYQKFGWPGVFVTKWLLTAIPALQARFYFSLFTALGYLWWHRRQKFAPRSFYNLLKYLAWYVCFYLIVLVCWARGEVRFWYFCLPVSFSFVTWGVWLHHLSFTHKRTLQICILSCLLVFGGYTVHKKLTWNAPVDAWKTAEWIKQKTADSVRIFQVDGSGLTGYFSERTVINGDGLINSWEYQRLLQQGDLYSYLEKMRVTHLVWNKYQDGADLRITIPLKDTPGIELSFITLPTILARFGRIIVVPFDPANISIKYPN